jgi:hypothetical protein
MKHINESIGFMMNFRLIFGCAKRLMKPFQTLKEVEEEAGFHFDFHPVTVIGMNVGDYHSFAPEDIDRMIQVSDCRLPIYFSTLRSVVENLQEHETAQILSLQLPFVRMISPTSLDYMNRRFETPIFQLLLQMGILSSNIHWE